MTFLELTIELLRSEDFYVISKEVEIAKGKHEYPYTWRKVWKKIKREYKWQFARQSK